MACQPHVAGSVVERSHTRVATLASVCVLAITQRLGRVSLVGWPLAACLSPSSTFLPSLILHSPTLPSHSTLSATPLTSRTRLVPMPLQLLTPGSSLPGPHVNMAATTTTSPPSHEAPSSPPAPPLPSPSSPPPESTLQPSPCVIDHTAYPAIMDLIVDSAPYASLLVLRATCKTYCDRIGEGAHVYLAVSNKRPFFRNSSGRQVPLADILLARSSIRALDDFASLTAVEPALFPSLKVVRLWYGQVRYLKITRDNPRTYVLFCWRAEHEEIALPWPYILHSDLKTVIESDFSVSQLPSPGGLQPPGLSKLILNVDCRPWFAQYFTPLGKVKWINLSEVTVVFHESHGHGPETDVPCDKHHLAHAITRLFHAILRAWVASAGTFRATIVYAQAVPASTFGRSAFETFPAKATGTPSPTFTTVQECFEFGSRHVAKPPTFEYLSMKEYEQKVGRIQFLLNTDEAYRLK